MNNKKRLKKKRKHSTSIDVCVLCTKSARATNFVPVTNLLRLKCNNENLVITTRPRIRSAFFWRSFHHFFFLFLFRRFPYVVFFLHSPPFIISWLMQRVAEKINLRQNKRACTENLVFGFDARVSSLNAVYYRKA